MKLILKDVTKSYGKNLALDRFSAELTPGIYALLGPNGSGKSTLMNIITDNLKADSGEIIYADDNGKKENALDMGVRFREKLGFMPQYPGMYPNFSVERFMSYMAALKGMERKTAKDKIEEILSAVELDDVHKRRIGALSGGMKQRLALAQAVLGDPEILILDEPTAGLDPKQRITIRNYISKISLDKIVLIATHVVQDIEFIAKEAIMLKKGVIVDKGRPAELISKISGKVWSVPCSQDEIRDYQEKFTVVNISGSDGGDATLRILSDERPSEYAITTAPALEDYYLSVFGKNEISA